MEGEGEGVAELLLVGEGQQPVSLHLLSSSPVLKLIRKNRYFSTILVATILPAHNSTFIKFD